MTDRYGNPRDWLTPEAFVLSCQRCRPTAHLHGWHARDLGAMVEALLRERDEARAEVERVLVRGAVTDEHHALATALGLREGKHSAASIARVALAEVERLRALLALVKGLEGE